MHYSNQHAIINNPTSYSTKTRSVRVIGNCKYESAVLKLQNVYKQTFDFPLFRRKRRLWHDRVAASEAQILEANRSSTPKYWPAYGQAPATPQILNEIKSHKDWQLQHPSQSNLALIRDSTTNLLTIFKIKDQCCSYRPVEKNTDVP